MIIILIVIAFAFVLFMTRGAFSPARLFAIMWTILILGYYCFSAKTISGFGLLWIAAAMVVLAVGERIGVGYAVKKYKPITDKVSISITKSTSRNLFAILLLLIVIALLGEIIFLHDKGYNFTVFFNLNKFLAMNSEMANDRYSGVSANSLVTLLSAFSYIAPLCGGYLLSYTCKRKRRILLCFLSLLPIILSMAIENTKSGVIDATILFAVGYMVSFMQVYKCFPKFKTKQIVIVICLGAILAALLFFAMCVRIGDFSKRTIDIVKEKIIVYAFGSVEAFDVWLTGHYSLGTYGFGINTFMAPFSLLGIVTREQGVYDFIPGASSNVFSAYRGVIMDFGIFGGLLFMFVIGIVAGITYRKIRSCGTVGSQFIYAVLMFFLLRSWLISPWIYTSFWVAFVVFLLLLLLVFKRTCKRSVKVQRFQTA